MSGAAKKTEQDGPKVPAYIVTFSDMVTLLLTFFVMLLTLADVQDPELFDIGRDSFVESVRYMGLGMLNNRAAMQTLDKVKIKYAIPEAEELCDQRLIDYREEHLRRMFSKIDEDMDTRPSQLKSQNIRFSVTNIKFAKADAELDQAGMDFLADYALDMTRNCPEGSVKLYIVALADDVRGKEKQWFLSARRAAVVEQFLRDALPAGFDCPIYSSGAGPSTNLIDDESSANSQVLMAALHKKAR